MMATEETDPLSAAARLVASFAFEKDGRAKLGNSLLLNKDGEPIRATFAYASRDRVAKFPDGAHLDLDDLLIVVSALHAFLTSGANDLDTAFGGSPRERRNAMKKDTVDFAIKWLVDQHTKEAKEVPKNERQGEPRNIGILETADDIGMSPDEVRKRFYGER